jgi:hypothetical protein
MTMMMNVTWSRGRSWGNYATNYSIITSSSFWHFYVFFTEEEAKKREKESPLSSLTK